MEARYLAHETGKRVGVLLDTEGYECLLEIEDEMEDVRRYDEAVARRERGEDDVVPWEQIRDGIRSEYEDPDDRATGSSSDGRPKDPRENECHRTVRIKSAKP